MRCPHAFFFCVHSLSPFTLHPWRLPLSLTSPLLASHLSCVTRQLTWERRVAVAAGLAEALVFLHRAALSHHARPPAASCSRAAESGASDVGGAGAAGLHHRDVRAATVLLGEDWRPMLVGAGLSRFVRGYVGALYTYTCARRNIPLSCIAVSKCCVL